MVRTLRRSLDILEAFDEAHRRMTVAEISEQIGLSRTTSLRLVQSLESAGYLVRLADQRYCLSLKLLDLARNVDSTLDIRAIVQPRLQELVYLTGETVALNMRHGLERICIDVAIPNTHLVRVVATGERVPLPIGAIGRVLSAYLDPTELERVIAGGHAGPRFDHTRFLESLATIRMRGYDIAWGERIAGTTAIAAPLFDSQGRVGHCLCVLGPSVRMDGREDAIIQQLVSEARTISRQLGYQIPDRE
ncbi:MAG: IclR family transcriptional regulator [Alphaproteobacteria bacterium]